MTAENVVTDSFPRRQAATRRFTLGAPRGVTIAPDGARVVFLRSRGGDDPVTCLWVLDVATKHYALATHPAWTPVSPFGPVAERLRADPTWTVHDLPITHNVLADGPDVLVGLVETVLADVAGR